MDIKELFVECEAFLQGHFLLSSGKHSDGYAQCARLMMHPDKAKIAFGLLKDQVKDLGIEVVVGPAVGGIIPSYELASQLNVLSVFTERENEVMTLRRGFTVEKGQKAIISEDVVTTGKSSLETIRAIEEYGVEVVGISCLVNRSGKTEVEGYPIFSALEIDIATFEKEECPLCKEGIPLVKPGSRKQAL